MIPELRPWPELQEKLPELASWEKEKLEESIEEDGILQPILCLPDGRIIDGVHRFEYYGDDGQPPFKVLDVTEDSGMALGLTLNAARRNLSLEQANKIWKPLEDSKEKRKETYLELRDKDDKTQEEASEAVGVTQQAGSKWEQKEDISNTTSSNTNKPRDDRRTIRKDEKEEIVEECNSDKTQSEIAANHKISQPRVSQIVTQDESRENKPEETETPDVPEGKYKCIILDPPWPSEKIEREERPKQGKYLDYPVMTVEEIADLDVPDMIDPNGCHVYMWTTQKRLPDALDIFEKWDVRYECLLTWVKPTGMTPFSWMYNTEYVLFGRAGSGLKLLERGLKLSFEEGIKKHSRKPDAFYDLVRKASPEPRRNMFAREEREGFDAWGDEIGQED